LYLLYRRCIFVHAVTHLVQEIFLTTSKASHATKKLCYLTFTSSLDVPSRRIKYCDGFESICL